MATATAGAILEGTAPLRSEADGVVGAATGSRGTTVVPDVAPDTADTDSAAGATVARTTESQADDMAKTGISSRSQCGSWSCMAVVHASRRST